MLKSAALLLSCIVFGAASVAECPSNCPATASAPLVQTGGPPDTDFLMIFGAPTPGDGTLTCATCKQCEMIGSLTFHGNGTGWQVRVSTGGTGSSAALTDYSRIGRLDALCDSSDTLSVTFVGPGSSYSISQTITCGCTPP